jgi:CubicO group peptidase (beta-lactamase class C family)
MRTSHILVVGLCLLAAPAVRAAEILPGARPEEVGLSGEKLARIVPAVTKLVTDGSISGAVTVVARRGKVAHFEAVGLRDIAAKRAMEKDTVFRIYSMTKPVTAVAALILVEEGKLDLDAPVSKYIPAFKDLTVLVEGRRVEPKREMTVRDLARHTSGLTYGYFSRTSIDQMYFKVGVLDDKGDLPGMIEKLSKLPLLYHPGQRWHYSVSCDVLGRVVEVASGKTLDRFMKTRIFDPLGMVDTGFHVRKDALPRFATNYGPGRNRLSVLDDPATSRYRRPATLLLGGQGLVSTARDYLRFAQMLLNGGVLGKTRILKASTVKAMTTNQLDKKLVPIRIGGLPLAGNGFGLGLSVRVDRSPIPPFGTVGEYGWAGAATTSFWVVPSEKLIGMVLTQRMPYSVLPGMTVKPLVAAAIVREKKVEPEKAGATK